MNQNQEEAPVEQVDRDRAASLFSSGNEIDRIVSGKWDTHSHVQAFARHRIAAHNEGKREAYEAAVRLARTLYDLHWREQSPDWQPLPDTAGVIDQIDNMTALLVKPAKLAPEHQSEHPGDHHG